MCNFEKVFSAVKLKFVMQTCRSWSKHLLPHCLLQTPHTTLYTLHTTFTCCCKKPWQLVLKWISAPKQSCLFSVWSSVFFSISTWPKSSAEITFTGIEEICNLFLYSCPTLNSFTASPHSQNSSYFTPIQLQGLVIKALHLSSVHLHEAWDKQSGQ